MGILRILLAISVVLAHSSSIFRCSLVGGQLAVQAFYIISGFYMTLILNEKYINKNNSYQLFLSNRLLRLFPVYWVVLFLTLLYALLTAITSHGTNLGSFAIYKEYWDHLSWSSLSFLICTNIFLFLQDTVMFLGLDTNTGHLFFTANFIDTNPPLYKFLFLPQAWTIGVEITFYLMAPFIVRQKLKVIIPMIIISLALRLFLYTQFALNHDPWTYRFFPTELLFFLLGIVSYHIYKKIEKLDIAAYKLKLIWFYIIGFTFIYKFIPSEMKYTLYLGTFFICLPFIFLLSKNWKKDAYIGELSYPIYISHMLLLTIIQTLHLPTKGGMGLNLTIATILFAILLNELIAKKVEKLRQNRISAKPQTNQ